ncbi:MAG TPA: C40 family peptidase [Acidimicrobiales bacterium]|jgi:cell wall-associated NlpC family hydrolase|nr:C40 family peptidase [Acidimicrobiales bacterium]
MRAQRLLAATVAAVAAAGLLAGVDLTAALPKGPAVVATVGATVGANEPLAALGSGTLTSAGDLPATGSQPSAPTTVVPTASSAAASTTSLPSGLPAPSAKLPAVGAVGPLREVDAVVTLPGTITPVEVSSLLHTAGLVAMEEVDTGTVGFDGAPAATFGVDPGTFRDFTPAVTANKTALWQYLAAGAVASSYEMASDRKLPLGARLPIAAAGTAHQKTDAWLGAFMSVGIPGVDMVVSHQFSDALGLVPDSGLVISAPGMNPYMMATELQGELPGANVELTHPGIVVGSASGSYVGSKTISTAIAAAMSRLGAPYVWGGDGPGVFDCSGFVGWAYAQAGIHLPRTAAQQFLAGRHLTLAEAQPGDLLFWAYDPTDPTFIDHVAMYLGNGMMIVAPYTGTDVQVDPVPTANFAGVVRVDPTMATGVGGPQFP